jgi:hypothetical protein
MNNKRKKINSALIPQKNKKIKKKPADTVILKAGGGAELLAACLTPRFEQ